MFRFIAAALAALALAAAGQPKKPKPRRLSRKPLKAARSHPYAAKTPEGLARQRANLTDEGRRNGAAKEGDQRNLQHGAYSEGEHIRKLVSLSNLTFKKNAKLVERTLASAGSDRPEFLTSANVYLKTYHKWSVLIEQPDLPIEAQKIMLRLAEQLTELGERMGLTASSQSRLRLRQARELEARRVVPVMMQGGERARTRAVEVAFLLRDLGVIPEIPDSSIVDANVVEDDSPEPLSEAALRELGLSDPRAER